jgi:hypothetical protein
VDEGKVLPLLLNETVDSGVGSGDYGDGLRFSAGTVSERCLAGRRSFVFLQVHGFTSAPDTRPAIRHALIWAILARPSAPETTIKSVLSPVRAFGRDRIISNRIRASFGWIPPSARVAVLGEVISALRFDTAQRLGLEFDTSPPV